MALTPSHSAGSAQRQIASLVLTGGRVWTGVPQAPFARAVAVLGGRIACVGGDAEVQPYVGPGTRVVPLAGRLLIPGFFDSHTHFVDGGFQLGRVDLRDVDSPQALARRLAERAARVAPGEWILGSGWDEQRWEGAALPHHALLDSVTPRNPAFVTRLDLHMGVANRAALELAGIGRETADPEGGRIVRDAATGEATGVLKDEAMGLVWRVVPEPDADAYDAALRRAQAHALSLGVTHVTNMGTWTHLDAFRRARAEGLLGVRARAFVQIADHERLGAFVAEHGRGDARLGWGGVKAFVDGSLGSRTAWFRETYSDAPTERGLQVTDLEALQARIVSADAAHLQVAAHAIGDAANDWILDAFAAAARENGARDRRFRVEHAQHLGEEAVSRFAAQGVLASMQPYHASEDGCWAERRIGAARAGGCYRFRSLLDSGARLLFGSDWTVAPLDPIAGIHAAVTRRTLDGAHPDGWVPAERISLDEALRAYTADAAYGAFAEDVLGTIERGKLADLVVLSTDPFMFEAARIREVRVDATIVDGDVVFERSKE